MLEQIQAYKTGADPLKSQWFTYIDDKSIALDARWEAFIAAPDAWKTDYTQASMPYACLEAIGLNSAYDDLLIERHETHTPDQDIDHIESMIGDEDFNAELNSEHIDQMKEEVIAMRMASWTWDW